MAKDISDDRGLDTLSRLVAMACVEAHRDARTATVAHFLDIALMELGIMRRAALRESEAPLRKTSANKVSVRLASRQ